MSDNASHSFSNSRARSLIEVIWHLCCALHYSRHDSSLPSYCLSVFAAILA